MKNKPGFKVKIGSEEFLYFIIFVIVVVFIIFMPKIYKFISDVKTGNAFKSNAPVENNEIVNNKDDKDKEEIEEPKGDTTLFCSLSTSEAEGNTSDDYTFYYTNDKLQNLKNEKYYDAITDDYLNFLYSEQARFNSMDNLYKTVPGFSYTSTLESRNLKAIFIYDLTKLNTESLKNDDETLSINIDVNKDQSLEEVKTIYETLGYECK